MGRSTSGMSQRTNSWDNCPRPGPLLQVLPLARTEEHWPLEVWMGVSPYGRWNRKCGSRKHVSGLVVTLRSLNGNNTSLTNLIVSLAPNGRLESEFLTGPPPKSSLRDHRPKAGIGFFQSSFSPLIFMLTIHLVPPMGFLQVDGHPVLIRVIMSPDHGAGAACYAGPESPAEAFPACAGLAMGAKARSLRKISRASNPYPSPPTIPTGAGPTKGAMSPVV